MRRSSRFRIFHNLVLALLLVSGTTYAQSTSWGSDRSWASEGSGSRTAERPTTPSRRSFASRELYANRDSISPFAPSSHNVSINIGQIFLMGDTSNMYNNNIGGQARYTYGVSELFAFDASLGYSSHGDQKSQSDFSMTTLLAGLRTNLAWYDKAVPYFLFGMGFYRPSYSKFDSGAGLPPLLNVAPLLFGIHLGPGINLELSKQFFFGASLTFHDVFSTSRIVPGTDQKVDIGGSYVSFFLEAGLTF